MDVVTLKAEKRDAIGTRNCRRLRESGRLPGIIYGHGETPEPFSVSAHDVELELQHGTRVVTLDMGGAKHDCLIKEIQYDHLGRFATHIDLARVDLDERVQVKVAIEPRGVPKGISHGGILDLVLDSIEVECLARQIPDTFHPNVAELEVGDSITVGDLEVPEGIKILTDPSETVAIVHLLSTKAVEVEATEEEEAGPTEPERIGRVAETEEKPDAEK